MVKVKVGNVLSREVQVNTGLRQGDALSPIIFNLVLEKVIRMMNISPDEGVKLDGTSISILAYADDIVLLENNINTVKSLCERLITAARRVGLQINEEKTEYMEISRQRYGRQVEDFLKVGLYSFKNVSQFKYLGTMITQSNDMEYEILKRIQMGNKCNYAMGTLLKSRILSKTLKVQLYVTLIRSIILYGALCWTVRKNDESKLRVFERKILRRIYGPCRDTQTDECRKRHNEELYDLYNRPDIVKEIKRRTL